MSYNVSNYYQNPGPYYAGSDFDAPVPGWGLLPNIAGAARVGIGQIDPAGLLAPQSSSSIRVPPNVLESLTPVVEEGSASEGDVPWLLWLGVGAVVGVGAAVAQRKGWLRGVGLK